MNPEAAVSPGDADLRNGNLKSACERIVGQSVFVFGAQILGLSCAVLSNLLVARMLGPGGKGSIYLLQLIASTGPALLSFGLGPAAVYYMGREKLYSEQEIRSGVLWCSFSIGALPFLTAVFVWRWFGGIGGSKLSPFYLLLGLGMVPFAVLAWNASYLSLAQERTLAYNLLRSAQNLWFLLCLVLLFIFSHRTVFGVSLCWVISMLLLGAVAPLVSSVRELAPLPARRGFLRSAFRFGWRSHLGAVTQFLQQRVDVVLVSFICTLRDVGFYSLAVAVAEVLWYIPQTVGNVLMPYIAGSSEDGASRLTSSFCRAVFTLIAVLSVMLAILSAWVIPLLLPAFRASVTVIWLLLPGTMAASVSKVLSSDLNGRGMPMETFGPPAITLAVCAFAGLLVIPRFGIVGAALVTSFGHTLNTLLYVRAYSRITGVSIKELLLLSHRDVAVIHSYWKGFASQFSW